MALIDRFDRDIPLHSVTTGWLKEQRVNLDMLRLDLLHAQVSGNKWFKQKFHLQAAQSARIQWVLSFGGAWSNHIHALAAAGQLTGFRTIGVIRGEKPERLSATLNDALAWGMQLHFVSRSDYRQRYDPEYQQQLVRVLGFKANEIAVIPEGGGGELGVKGCETILQAGNIDTHRYDEIWLACGTGATLAGIARGLGSGPVIRGIAALKGAGFLLKDISEMIGNPDSTSQWVLETEYHCGGYARTTPELLDFIEQFELETDIPLDQVYTGKVMLALKHQIHQGLIKQGSRILVIHTGGLQGKRGL